MLAAPAAAAPDFEVAETGILDLQSALASGRVTSRQLVAAYQARMAAYDQAGPRLNALVTRNAAALAEADALDRERRKKGARGSLHGIPVLVKDNFDTHDMPTSGGTLALATLQPGADATQVARLRAAGAIILGKTTLHELASGIITVSSLTGFSRNPYDPARSPGGSSGGTGAAVAASFAAAGMGTDTCGSIRIPSAYQNLFGLRATRGLSSRAGVIPLSSTQDMAGPLARSVTDLAIMLDATVGPDPADASTVDAAAHVPKSYRDALVPGGLKGARIGVLRSLFADTPEDAEGKKVVDAALARLRSEGAEVFDVAIPDLADMLTDASVVSFEFKRDLAAYLAAHPGAPVSGIAAIIAAGLDHDQLDARFRDHAARGSAADAAAYEKALAKRIAARAATVSVIAGQRLDALLYPTTLQRPPFTGGDIGLGTSNCRFSAVTGLPALAVPAGFTPRGLPVGIELLGADFTEPRLLALAWGWEQAARPRQAPFSTPALINGKPPAPQAFTTRISSSQGRTTIRFRYDPLTAALTADVRLAGLGKDVPVAVTLHRQHDGGPGPVLSPLLLAGQMRGTMTLTLTGHDRADLAAGRLYAALYTRGAPLGAGQATLVLPGK